MAIHSLFMMCSLMHVKSFEMQVNRKVKKGSLLIDSSTIDPAVSKELAKEVEKMGAVFMDAPVSGGVGAARSGNLTFMVGGVEDEFAAAQELLGCMGSNVVYCGAVGTGQAAKICNNMLLAISMIGTAEAMNLGIRLGLDPKLLAKILNMSSGRCWSSDTYNPVPGVMDGVPSANNYQGGFGATLMAKNGIRLTLLQIVLLPIKEREERNSAETFSTFQLLLFNPHKFPEDRQLNRPPNIEK
uniref:3-hydroxyisobutyrate dehydrogenase, mitochondrial n=1 Tax=Canis lupus familiaris TaxID=9615 RepID=A0A8I3P2C3_CANLF